MSMTPVETHWPLVKRAALWAARSVTTQRGAEWIDDIAQIVVARVWLRHQAGFGVTRQQYRRLASGALNVLLGHIGYESGRAAAEMIPLDDVQVTNTRTRNPLAVISMHRLQALWPTLTDTQKAGVYSLIVDDGYGATGDAAELFGVSTLSICSARETALERINNPAAFTRKASVGVRDLPDEERKAYNREKAARYRARKQAAA